MEKRNIQTRQAKGMSRGVVGMRGSWRGVIELPHVDIWERYIKTTKTINTTVVRSPCLCSNEKGERI